MTRDGEMVESFLAELERRSDADPDPERRAFYSASLPIFQEVMREDPARWAAAIRRELLDLALEELLRPQTNPEETP